MALDIPSAIVDFSYGFSHGSTLKIRFWSRLEGTTPYNGKSQEATEPLDRLGFPVVWSSPMLFGVAAHKRLPKPFVAGSIPVGGTNSRALVPSASFSFSRHIGQRIPQYKLVPHTVRVRPPFI